MAAVRGGVVGVGNAAAAAETCGDGDECVLTDARCWGFNNAAQVRRRGCGEGGGKARGRCESVTIWAREGEWTRMRRMTRGGEEGSAMGGGGREGFHRSSRSATPRASGTRQGRWGR